MGQRSQASEGFGSYYSSSAGKVICEGKNKSFVPVGTGLVCTGGKRRNVHPLQITKSQPPSSYYNVVM